MIGIILRIVAYISVPLIIGFVKKGSLSKKQCNLITIIWAFIVSAFIAFTTSGGAEAIGMVIGGTFVGTFIANLAISFASKPKKIPTKIENNETYEANTITEQLENAESSIEIEESEQEKEDKHFIELSEGKKEYKKGLHSDSVDDCSSQEATQSKIEEGQPITDMLNTIPEDELRAIKRLYDAGVLTEKEFSEKKRMLLKI